MTSGRVAEILSDIWTGSPGGSALPSALVQQCAGALPVKGVGLALMTERGPAGTVARTGLVAPSVRSATGSGTQRLYSFPTARVPTTEPSNATRPGGQGAQRRRGHRPRHRLRHHGRPSR